MLVTAACASLCNSHPRRLCLLPVPGRMPQGQVCKALQRCRRLPAAPLIPQAVFVSLPAPACLLSFAASGCPVSLPVPHLQRRVPQHLLELHVAHWVAVQQLTDDLVQHLSLLACGGHGSTTRQVLLHSSMRQQRTTLPAWQCTSNSNTHCSRLPDAPYTDCFGLDRVSHRAAGARHVFCHWPVCWLHMLHMPHLRAAARLPRRT